MFWPRRVKLLKNCPTCNEKLHPHYSEEYDEDGEPNGEFCIGRGCPIRTCARCFHHVDARTGLVFEIETAASIERWF